MVEAVVKAQEIRGWMSEEELLWLFGTARKMNSIVELGCFCGRSTYVLCAGCAGTVYAADCHWCGTMHPFETGAQYTRPEFDQYVGHFANLVPFEGNFMEAAVSDLIPQEFDMVFFDGDHSKESQLLDLQTWAHRAKKLICGHDLDPSTPGIEQALQEFCGMQGVVRAPGKLWYIEKGG